MAYIGNGPGVASQRIVSTLTATDGQTSFTPTSGYTVGYVDVYLNGVKLISGTDFTASNGTNVVLTTGAATGDTLEVVAYLPRGLSDGYTKAEADARYYTQSQVDSEIAAIDLTAFNSPVQLKNYTTTERNALTGLESGDTIYNSTSGSIEFYDGANWIATNLIPTVNSVTGNIYSGISSTITLSLTNATDTIDVNYYESGVLLATDSAVTVTSGSATSTVPSAVYGQSAGDTISIQIFNQDGTPSSNSINKTVFAVPTGGVITVASGYRIHTFNSSSTFSIPSGLTLSNVEYLVIAGGGGGGSGDASPSASGGGGGAGGYRCSVPGDSSGGGSSAESRIASLTAGSYSVTIGAGGSARVSSGGSDGSGYPGSNSVFSSITSIGGGGGGCGTAYPPDSGGSGGGGDYGAGGSGTSGQGYTGGTGRSNPYYGGGGGGAGQTGRNYNTNSGRNGDGGSGVPSTITGSSVYRAGGGGAGVYSGNYTGVGLGGAGGGGNGGRYDSPGQAGTANTGGGGGGGPNPGYNGGSGVVIIRYQI
jgi:hypothetical protein